MPKPFVNLEDVEFTDIEENGYYTSRRAEFSAGIGARQLGYNLTELLPGKAQCPFHAPTPLRYLTLSTLAAVEVCEYPDSGKTGVFAAESTGGGLRRMFRSEATVEYYDRENTHGPRHEH